MKEIAALRAKAEVSARQRVSEFVALSRDGLTNLISSECWLSDKWDVSAASVRKGKPRNSSRLYFFQLGTLTGRGGKAAGMSFHPAFRDFAKAYIRYSHSAAPVGFGRMQIRLHALSYIEAAFRHFSLEPDIIRLSPEVLTKAVQMGVKSVSPKVQYYRSTAVEQIYNFCLKRSFLSANFLWRHGVPRPQEPGERIGVDFSRRRAEKLPSRRAFEALAHIYRQPQNLRDRLISAVCLICICSPWRASEVLEITVDCEVRETRHEGARQVPTYGLRAYPGKGNLPQVKWMPDIAAVHVQGAISRLRAECDEARKIAAWYIKNPDRIYLPSNFEHLRTSEWITHEQIAELIGLRYGADWIKRAGITPCDVARYRPFRYRFSEFEKVILSYLPKDFPFQNGKKTHPYDRSLILVRQGALRAQVGGGSQVMFEPIDTDQFNRWLSGTPSVATVFKQYGFNEEDGSPIKITTHAFRHWNNNLGHLRGLSQADLALWSGRDPAQNKYYDHQTPEEFRADLLEMAFKAGGVGPVFDALDNLPDTPLISREKFLREQIGSAHVTEVGACFHDYALQPCQNHGDCITCEENGFIKGDGRHRAAIAELLALTERQLEAARAAMAEDDYGADLWVQDHEKKLARIQVMLSRHEDPNIPDGAVVTLPADRQDSEIEQAIRLRVERNLLG